MFLQDCLTDHPRLAYFAVALAAAAWFGSAGAQNAVTYPARNIQIVVPYTPGTGADILSRVFGPQLAERWKIGVITDNRAGAAGNIGADFVARAAPDGHTLLFTATSFSTNPALGQKLSFDPVKSFAPVVLVATSALALVVNPYLPVKSMREFLSLARRHPGELHYSSPGTGGPQHLAMELLKLETGLNLVHVPYKGSAGAISDVVGGHVQATIAALQTAGPSVRGGKLRMLAVMGPRRSPVFPEAPTLKELGLANLEVETWYGIFAPAGTPAHAIAKLNAEMNALLQHAGTRELLANHGMSAAGGGPERLADLVKRELARWSRVVAAAGIRTD